VVLVFWVAELWAVNVTVVAPIGNVAPLAALLTTATTPVLSLAVGDAKVTAAPVAPVASRVILLGTPTKAGAEESFTFTRKVPVLVFPTPSVAVTVTVVLPIGNTSPLAFEYVIVGLTVTLSVAVAAG